MDNKEIIAEYIKRGCKLKKTNQIGIELEHFVVEKATGRNVPYSGDGGVGAVLEDISKNYDKKVYSDGFLIGLSNGKYHITIEPAAQLEISILPTEDISEAEKIYEEFIGVIAPALDKYGYTLMCEGCRRGVKTSELELIPKKRYEFMDKYFETSGSCGKHMMRATASVQVSIDYADEDDCARKFAAANAISPLLALICDNSVCLDGDKYSGRMARTHIWKNVDKDRCGIVPCAFDKDFGFYKYAEYIYKNPPIFVFDKETPCFTGKRTAESIYENKIIDEAETEHLLSMFFPDVRLKQYIEIRPADSMPVEYALSYAALIKGIFAEENIPKIKGISARDAENAKNAIMHDGFNASVYGRKAYEICDMMLETAKNNLDFKHREYLKPMEKIIKSRRTLREEKECPI